MALPSDSIEYVGIKKLFNGCWTVETKPKKPDFFKPSPITTMNLDKTKNYTAEVANKPVTRQELLYIMCGNNLETSKERLKSIMRIEAEALKKRDRNNKK